VVSTVALAQTDSVANWVAAIGQCLGAVGTLAAVGVALWLARWERRRDTAERRDEEKAQARLVVSRLLFDATNRVAVLNNSSAQVLDVDVVYSADDRPDGLVGELRPMQPLPIDVLKPGESETLSVMYLSADRDAVVATDECYRSQGDKVTITFTDSNGRRVVQSQQQLAGACLGRLVALPRRSEVTRAYGGDVVQQRRAHPDGRPKTIGRSPHTTVESGR
jgi:hypothetical protein